MYKSYNSVSKILTEYDVTRRTDFTVNTGTYSIKWSHGDKGVDTLTLLFRPMEYLDTSNLPH